MRSSGFGHKLPVDGFVSAFLLIFVFTQWADVSALRIAGPIVGAFENWPI
ncbi:hypothetical protein GOZ90_05795 [Agrobacterium vitis]|uniref:Uncharacterized protein n=1 Tax=Agrobacterium vitis TaxID=373 RepID=A0A6L6VDD7_AGRVI|nr:hypothetical protein [Agrobacterium vitis]MUZ72189.1 hypothetical protein [Agrobacterium vitis]